jgi:predicted lipid-binding transport protein (Tim44 family)
MYAVDWYRTIGLGGIGLGIILVLAGGMVLARYWKEGLHATESDIDPHQRLYSQPRRGVRMANDRAMGGAIFGGSLIGIILYGLLLYYWSLIVLEITAFLGILILLGILGWIGYTMATTPPPEPITDIPEVKEGPQASPEQDKQ